MTATPYNPADWVRLGIAAASSQGWHAGRHGIPADRLAFPTSSEYGKAWMLGWFDGQDCRRETRLPWKRRDGRE